MYDVVENNDRQTDKTRFAIDGICYILFLIKTCVYFYHKSHLVYFLIFFSECKYVYFVCILSGDDRIEHTILS